MYLRQARIHSGGRGSGPLLIFQSMGLKMEKLCQIHPGLKLDPPEIIFWIHACVIIWASRGMSLQPQGSDPLSQIVIWVCHKHLT